MLIFGIFRNTKYIEIINYIITTLKTDIISVLILDCRLLQYNTLLEDTVPVRYIKQIIEKTAILIINYIITTLKTDIISVLVLDCRLLQYNTLLEDTVPGGAVY